MTLKVILRTLCRTLAAEGVPHNAPPPPRQCAVEGTFSVSRSIIENGGCCGDFIQTFHAAPGPASDRKFKNYKHVNMSH